VGVFVVQERCHGCGEKMIAFAAAVEVKASGGFREVIIRWEM
jgi:hypothetical protein